LSREEYVREVKRIELSLASTRRSKWLWGLKALCLSRSRNGAASKAADSDVDVKEVVFGMMSER